jgi:hypothetical protein
VGEEASPDSALALALFGPFDVQIEGRPLAGMLWWVLSGDEGVLRLQRDTLLLNDQPVTLAAEAPLPGEPALHAEFLAAITEGRAPAQASGRETLRSIAAIEAAQRSARDGSVITLL